jgi:hypothetical protein
MSLKCMTMLWVSYVSGGRQIITHTLASNCMHTIHTPSRAFTQSFDLAFEVLTLNQIGDFVIVVLAAFFLLPTFLLLQALVTLR